MNATDLESPGRLTTFELVDLEGNVLSRIPTSYIPGQINMYNSSSFVPPDAFFYVRVR